MLYPLQLPCKWEENLLYNNWLAFKENVKHSWQKKSQRYYSSISSEDNSDNEQENHKKVANTRL